MCRFDTSAFTPDKTSYFGQSDYQPFSTSSIELKIPRQPLIGLFLPTLMISVSPPLYMTSQRDGMHDGASASAPAPRRAATAFIIRRCRNAQHAMMITMRDERARARGIDTAWRHYEPGWPSRRKQAEKHIVLPRFE